MLFVNLFTTDTKNLLAPKSSEDMQCNTEPENDPAPVPKHREISIQAVPCTCDVNIIQHPVISKKVSKK